MTQLTTSASAPAVDVASVSHGYCMPPPTLHNSHSLQQQKATTFSTTIIRSYSPCHLRTWSLITDIYLVNKGIHKLGRVLVLGVSTSYLAKLVTQKERQNTTSAKNHVHFIFPKEKDLLFILGNVTRD
jgi:hypothetical protein